MAEFFAQYGLFLLKVATIVVAILIVLGGVAIMVASSKAHGRDNRQGHIKLKALHEHYHDTLRGMQSEILSAAEIKALNKADKDKEKEKKKADKQKAKQLKKSEKQAENKTKVKAEETKKRNYVVNFDGDVNASEVENLREEISAILSVAKSTDEIIVRLESPGGVVHGYGLAASQLQRVRDKDIPLTICVDKVAASGGYMMACIGNAILAAPFAIIGSVGVVAQLPNFHRVLKKNDVDFELFTAGDYKRTVTMFGENTEQGKQKFQQELEETHVLFKNFVSEHRPQLDIDKIATGEHWFAKQAKELSLVDMIKTSDEYLQEKAKDGDVFEVTYVEKKPLASRLGITFSEALMHVWNRLIKKDLEQKF